MVISYLAKKIVHLHRKLSTGCSAVGSALRSGRRGRRFESCHPDKKLQGKQVVLSSCLFIFGYKNVLLTS